jgi:hypothetical protein
VIERMRQFYETYRDDKKVAPQAPQLPWTQNLLILSKSKGSGDGKFRCISCEPDNLRRPQQPRRQQGRVRLVERHRRVGVFPRDVGLLVAD